MKIVISLFLVIKIFISNIFICILIEFLLKKNSPIIISVVVLRRASKGKQNVTGI